MDAGMMGGMGLWMVLWGVIGIALLVLVVAATIRLIQPRAGREPVDGPDAEAVLRSRYAAGEISQDDYFHQLDMLRRT